MAEPTSNGGTTWRLADLERRMGNVEMLPTTVARMDEKIDAIARRQDERDEEVKALRRAIVGAAITFAAAGAALVYAAQSLAGG